MRARGGTVAIGRLSPGGAWLGLEPLAGGWRVVFGGAGGSRAADVPTAVQRELVLAAAGAYFEDALADPPPELEATHADIAAVVAWLLSSETDAERRPRLRQALDAIEDGLAVDEVIGRLLSAGPQDVNEPADWVDRLVDAYRSLDG